MECFIKKSYNKLLYGSLQNGFMFDRTQKRRRVTLFVCLFSRKLRENKSADSFLPQPIPLLKLLLQKISH